MRIALLLSGLPREWRLCMPSQLVVFGDNRPDVFFHFWDVIDDSEKEEIVDALKPRAYKFEPLRDFSAWDTDPNIILDRINIPSRMLSQYTSWCEVARLFEQHIPDYQLAMRSRSDIQFVRSLAHIPSQLKPRQVVLPWAVKDSLISDLFAFGDPRGIWYYQTLADHIADYAKTEIFNSELLLAHHLKQDLTIRYLTDAFEHFYFVRRPHMADYTIKQALSEKAGRSKWLTDEIVEAHRAFHKLRSGEAGEQYVEQFAANQKRSIERMATEEILKKKE